MVTMGTVAILIIFNLECTSAHHKDNSCEVLLKSHQILFLIFSYHGNGGHIEKCQTINAHLHIPGIIHSIGPKKIHEEKKIPIGFYSKLFNYLKIYSKGPTQQKHSCTTRYIDLSSYQTPAADNFTCYRRKE